MIDCPYCGKRHRSDEQVDKCKATAERRQARVAKIAAEVERRRNEAAHFPWKNVVRRMRHEGYHWERIVSHLKKNYPPPTEVGGSGDEWTLWTVVEAWAETWPLPLPLEQKVELLLERHFTGQYMSLHPGMFMLEYVRNMRARPDYDDEVPLLTVSEFVNAFREEETEWSSSSSLEALPSEAS